MKLDKILPQCEKVLCWVQHSDGIRQGGQEDIGDLDISHADPLHFWQTKRNAMIDFARKCSKCFEEEVDRRANSKFSDKQIYTNHCTNMIFRLQYRFLLLAHIYMRTNPNPGIPHLPISEAEAFFEEVFGQRFAPEPMFPSIHDVHKYLAMVLALEYDDSMKNEQYLVPLVGMKYDLTNTSALQRFPELVHGSWTKLPTSLTHSKMIESMISTLKEYGHPHVPEYEQYYKHKNGGNDFGSYGQPPPTVGKTILCITHL